MGVYVGKMRARQRKGEAPSIKGSLLTYLFRTEVAGCIEELGADYGKSHQVPLLGKVLEAARKLLLHLLVKEAAGMMEKRGKYNVTQH